MRHRARGPAREREGPGARADAQARCPHTAPEPRFSARIPGSQATPPHCATAPRASCRENRARAVKSKRFGNPLPPLSSRTGFPTWQNARRQESSHEAGFASQAATDLAARLRATRRRLRMPGKIQPIWLSQFENALTGSSYNLRFGDLNDEHDEPEVGKGSRIGSTLPRFSYARIIARKTRFSGDFRVFRAMMRRACDASMFERVSKGALLFRMFCWGCGDRCRRFSPARGRLPRR